MNEKIIISLTSIFAGVLISHIFELIRDKKRVKQLKKALITELADIQERLERISQTYERSIQIGALNGIDNAIPLLIGNFIFNTHYAELAIYLRASQRKSYEVIHGYVKSINAGIERSQKLHDIVTENLTEKNIEKWNDFLSSQYQISAMAYWHTSYHLKNPDFPFLENQSSPEYQSMLNAIKESKIHVRKLKDDAQKNLSPEMFE